MIIMVMKHLTQETNRIDVLFKPTDNNNNAVFSVVVTALGAEMVAITCLVQ